MSVSDDEPLETNEKRLLCAVLERCFRDILETSHMPKHVRSMAWCWMYALSDPKDLPPFSFEWVCEHLDVSPNAVRDIIRSYCKNPRSYIDMPEFKIKCSRHKRPVLSV